MKVFALSDLHLSINNPKPMDIFGGAWVNYIVEVERGWRECVSADDIVLIAGDISWAMKPADVRPDLEYLSTLPGKKVLTRGNHDYWWQSIGGLRRMLPEGMFALQNDAIRIQNVIIGGSRGWSTPESGEGSAEDKKIYDRELIRLGMSLAHMQKLYREGDKRIVMLHYPPFNSRMTGSPFTDLIAEFGADAVIYGHLHGKGCRIQNEIRIRDIPYYLTSCDLVQNKPVLILDASYQPDKRFTVQGG